MVVRWLRSRASSSASSSASQPGDGSSSGSSRSRLWSLPWLRPHALPGPDRLSQAVDPGLTGPCCILRDLPLLARQLGAIDNRGRAVRRLCSLFSHYALPQRHVTLWLGGCQWRWKRAARRLLRSSVYCSRCTNSIGMLVDLVKCINLDLILPLAVEKSYVFYATIKP